MRRPSSSFFRHGSSSIQKDDHGQEHLHGLNCSTREVCSLTTSFAEVDVDSSATKEKQACQPKTGAEGCGTLLDAKDSEVCTICYMRSLQKKICVTLECKHLLCNVCYTKVYSCPFCRCPFHGAIGKKLKRATKMFLCLMKEFKNKCCCRAAPVILLITLLEKTKEQAKQLDPEKDGVRQIKSRIHTLFGTVYFKLLGELGKAGNEYQEALNLYSENLEAMNLYAGVLFRQSYAEGKSCLQKAIRLMEHALKQDPENAILQCNLSKYYAHAGNLEAAQKLLDSASQTRNLNCTIQRYISCNKRFLQMQLEKAKRGDCVTGVQELIQGSTSSSQRIGDCMEICDC